MASTTAPPGAAARDAAAPGLFRRPSRNVAALDGLRALATAAVVLFHCAMFSKVAPVFRVPPGGLTPLQQWLGCLWTGVDVFFVLSGFLVGRILLDGARTRGHLPYRRFWVRRAFRIFPAYYFVLIASLVSIGFWGGPVTRFVTGGDWAMLRARSWSNLLYVNNYFFPGKAPNILSWGWSLCVEEHFYLLLPFVLAPIVRIRSGGVRLALLVVITLATLASRAVQYLGGVPIVMTDGFYYYSHNRFDELFLGVVVAELYVSHGPALRRVAKRSGSLLWIAGVTCIGAVWAFGGLYRADAFTVIWQFFLVSLGAALLIVNGLTLANSATRLLSYSLWYPLARVSYGTYLLHPFVIFILLDWRFVARGDVALSPLGLLGFFLGVLAITALAAALLYTVLERPCLRLGTWLGGRG